MHIIEHGMRVARQFPTKSSVIIPLRRIAWFGTKMAGSAGSMKRKAVEGPISPPQTKRSIQSGTTKKAVASFFTPASQKPKDKTTWSERSAAADTPGTLLVAKYETDVKEDESIKRHKIAAFDLDSTLISTASGKKHAGDEGDWKWWHSEVPEKLRSLYKDGYRVVILSNQGGLTLHADPKSKAPKASGEKRVTSFKKKCSAILAQLDLPVTLYAATGKDRFRKPQTGMWEEACKDYKLSTAELDLENSIFVGDAGGRMAVQVGGSLIPKDFSCSDRNLAHNIGIAYNTPEEYFLGEQARQFRREIDILQHEYTDTEDGVSFEKKHSQEMVVFCGPPGAGKSTLFKRVLSPIGFERINQDTLKTRDKCLQVAKECLGEGKSVAIDNTNPDPEVRKIWIDLANKFKVPVRCVWFSIPIALCEHNDAVRATHKAMNPENRERLPKLAFTGFASRYKTPQIKEGFEDITEITFQFKGSREEHGLWSRYYS